MRFFAVVCILSVATFFAGAAAAASYGTVKVGQAIPHNLSAQDQKAASRSFGDLAGERGLTLVFIRSAEWCSYCQTQLLDLNKNAAAFKERGYPLVTVSYDNVDQLARFAEKNGTKITMLSDPASQIIKAFGLLDEQYAMGTRAYGVPHPGVYIIGKDQKVEAMFFEQGYETRPSVSEILASIEPVPEPQPEPVPAADAAAPAAEAVTDTPAVMTEPSAETLSEPVTQEPVSDTPVVDTPVDSPVETPVGEAVEGSAMETPEVYESVE